MQLTQSPKFNRNYAAKIVEIKEFIKHPNPKCERLKCCTIDGYSIAVSIDTNPDGRVYEFSARQVQQWCTKEGLKSVEEYYYGYAKDLYPEHWNENFIQKLASDKNFFMECESPTCNNKVPHEGVVIKIENSLSEAYKLKCIKFLEGESKSLDKGEVDIETES